MKIAWDTTRSKLKLEHRQATVIEYLINRQKDSCAELCEAPTADNELSPIEYIADLILKHTAIDDESLEKELVKYMAAKKRAGSTLTYLKFWGTYQNTVVISIEKEMHRLLKGKQKTALNSLNLESGIAVLTGYSPVANKLNDRLDKLKVQREIDTVRSVPLEYSCHEDNRDDLLNTPSGYTHSIDNLCKDTLIDWETFQSTLELEHEQSIIFEYLINRLKDSYAELWETKTADNELSPIEYAVSLKQQNLLTEEKIFLNKVADYLSTKKRLDSGLTYLKHWETAKKSVIIQVKEEINKMLSKDQIKVFKSLKISNNIDIETGYDPVSNKITKRMHHALNDNASNDNKTLNDYAFISKTFCILPWIHSYIDVNGKVDLCCIASRDKAVDNKGTGHSLQRQSLQEIWNSAEMKKVRRKMMSGEKVQECSRCDRQAGIGEIPFRHNLNYFWLVMDRDREKWRQRVTDSISNEFTVPGPIYYNLAPGNLCTLKCRMCDSYYSSLIEKDPVHDRWIVGNRNIEGTKLSDGNKWYDVHGIFIEEILENIQETRMFYFAGGEPLVNPFVNQLIDMMIERQVAHDIRLNFSTNLSVFPTKLFEKLNHFHSIELVISIDGFGPVYEYIRYPAKWEQISRNLEMISHYSKFTWSVLCTVQNYNILSINDLLKYTESINLRCDFLILQNPVYLSIGVMPEKARILAVSRLKELIENTEKSPETTSDLGFGTLNISNVIVELEQDTEELYRKSIHEFMLFTNDLDKSRKQSFKDVCPELYSLIIEDGIAWTDELRYADSSRKKIMQS